MNPSVKTFDVIALGELNVDLILNRVDGLPVVGKEIFAREMTCTLGSSTAIFAANIASLGVRTAFAGMIGRDDFGALVRRSLDARGVDTRYVIESEHAATGATLVLSYGEDRANVTYPGAMEQLHYADLDPELFRMTRHIHISSLFMQPGLLADIGPILRAAHDNGVTVSLDTQWDPSETWKLDCREVLPLVDVFMPNESELKALTCSTTLDEAIDRVRPFLRRAMVVKCGSRGSILVASDGTRRAIGALLNPHAVDTIGAGDSFNAGFVSRFIRGASLEACQDMGNIMGAISTTAAGGTGAFADRESIERTARQHFAISINEVL